MKCMKYWLQKNKKKKENIKNKKNYKKKKRYKKFENKID